MFPPFQEDQGLGIGTASPLFNRWTASATRFIKLWEPAAGTTKRAPGSLVVHGRAGAAVGTLPAYDAFLLGGPYSGAPLLRANLHTGRALRCAALCSQGRGPASRG